MNVLSRITCLLLLAGPLTAAETDTGSVCVASRSDDPWWKVPAPEAFKTNGLRLRIDKRPPAAWPEKESLKIDELDLTGRHLLVILDSRGKPIESLWFRFSGYKSTNLCMSYDGYQGVSLKEANRHTPWCKCKYK